MVHIVLVTKPCSYYVQIKNSNKLQPKSLLMSTWLLPYTINLHEAGNQPLAELGLADRSFRVTILRY